MRVLLALAFLSAAAQAQTQFVGRVHLGVDDHRDLGDLALWQTAEHARLLAQGIAAQATDAFPAFVSADISIGLALESVEVGLLAGTSSTGGRLAASDYSGSLIVERIAERITVGVYGEARPLRVGPVDMGAGLAIRLNRTTVTYHRLATVSAEAAEDVTVRLKGSSISLEPRLLAEALPIGPLSAQIQLGWEGSSPAELAGSNDLPDGAGLPTLTVGWNGLRGRAGVADRLGG